MTIANEGIIKKKKILLVTGSTDTAIALSKQTIKYFGESIECFMYMVDEKASFPVDGNFFTVFSSEEVRQDFIREGLFLKIDDYIVANRTIPLENLKKVLVLPRDEKILLVNESRDSARDTIKLFAELKIDFLDLIPYYPNCKNDVRGINIAITPGEIDKVPSGVSSVYDIGPRLLDFATLTKMAFRINGSDEKIQKLSDDFFMQIYHLTSELSNIAYDTSKIMKTVRAELIGRGYYAKYKFIDIIGKNSNFLKTKKIAKKIAKTNLTVLIQGETGTGKELFASSIHNASDRIKKPFVAINLSALSDELVESELFGYVEGSFTGAKKGGKIGLFQQANSGTIFLDEIGDISLKMQSKLLRVLEEKEIMKVGGDKIVPIDVRIIAATNKNLGEMVKEKLFRKDLYYRLKQGYICIPSLRNRSEDIPLLIEYWMRNEFNKKLNFDGEIKKLFLEHDWPGNIRELYNVIKYAVAISDTNSINVCDLPFEQITTNQMKLSNNLDSSNSVNNSNILSNSGDNDNIGNKNNSFSDDSSIIGMQVCNIKILKIVNQLNEEFIIAGRKKIGEKCENLGIHITDYKLRKILNELCFDGYIVKITNSYGMQITEKGLNLLLEEGRKSNK